MKKTILLAFFTLLVPRTHAADLNATALLDTGRPGIDLSAQRSYRAWKLSLISVAASQAMDISSSYGLRELNPTLADSNGRFGAQSAAMKVGIAAGIMGIEYLLVRKHPGAAKVLWKVNLGSAAVTGAVAAHNYSLR